MGAVNVLLHGYEPPGMLVKTARMLDHGATKRRLSTALPEAYGGEIARMYGHSEKYKPW
jgi:hypothetical protein